jgi:hypothetical protein
VVASLVEADFVGSTPDVHDQVSLIFQLGLIYNLDWDYFSRESVVTKICFSYVE